MPNSKDFTALKSDLEDWLIPSGAAVNLQSQITTFILLAEELHVFGDAERDVPGIRIRDMLKRVELIGDSSRFIDFPGDYLDMRRLKLVTGNSNTEKLKQRSLEALKLRTGSLPTQYALGDQIEFNSDVADTQKVEMTYYAPLKPLSDADPTNFLLSNAYGTYLYGSLLHAAPYLADDERLKTWTAAYAQAAGRIQQAEHRGRYNQGELRVTVQGATP